jgi:hypothetical protein
MALLGLVFGAIALGVLLVLGRVLVALVVGLLALGWMVVMGVLALSVGSGVVVGAVLGTAWGVLGAGCRCGHGPLGGGGGFAPPVAQPAQVGWMSGTKTVAIE